MTNDASEFSQSGFFDWRFRVPEDAPWRFYVLLVVLLGILGVMGYKISQRYVIPAYGERPHELSRLKDVDPRRLSGDDLTSLRSDELAFAREVGNLDWRLSFMFDQGDGHFERPFQTASSATYGVDNDGLGPTYNAKSCEDCHQSDGRSLPVPGQGLLVRLSVPGETPEGGPVPHPMYGGQFGDVAIDGVPAEGSVVIDYEEISGTYGDGTPYSLRKPIVRLEDLAYGPLGLNTMMSPRAPLAMFGLGLLEAISDDDILSWADPLDEDGDGISGKANMVWDAEFKDTRIGRFGWKAEQPTIVTQTADAAHNDMGVTTEIFPQETCTEMQTDCKRAQTGADPEQPHEMTRVALEELRAYLAFLSVPARGHLDNATVQRGEELFTKIGCDGCHMAKMVTGNDHEWRRLRNKTIQPFTDLLLHDMGEGLSDNRPSFLAEGREWRTAPLWGGGLIERVNGHTNLLHDGRARDHAEAILWHGGEGEASKESFRTLSADDRQAIINFLKSL